MMRGLLPCLVLLPVLAMPAALARAQDTGPEVDATLVPPAGDFLQSPVYYEHFRARYSRAGDLKLLRSGRVRVQHFGPVDVSTFQWFTSSSTNYTWWMQMEELRFLLPAIASDRPSDRAIAKDWLARWFTIHMAGNAPPRLWGEPMTWAYRAMVMVYYLKTELRRDAPDPDVVGMLRGALLEHQEFLSRPENFDARSNHGLIDALGLLETTRVYADSTAIRRGNERMRSVIRASVSPRGAEIEQAAYYHFVFLRWLDEIRAYAPDASTIDSETVDLVRRTTRSMRDAAYFLQDQQGGIPQIGDTDSSRVDGFDADYRLLRSPGGATSFFDPAAGYAIEKDPAWTPARRYVVFCIPPSRAQMTYHRHDDPIAVLVALDGETVLGDAGRFEYEDTVERRFFVSGRAHNTVLLAATMDRSHTGLRTVRAVADRTSPAGAVWSAGLNLGTVHWFRTVRVPARGDGVAVLDTLHVANASTPARERRVVVLWNIGHDVAAVRARSRRRGGTWSWELVTRRGRRAVLTLRAADPALVESVRVARGEKSPLLGWYSPNQGEMRPVSVIVATVRVDADTALETRLDAVRGPRKRH